MYKYRWSASALLCGSGEAVLKFPEDREDREEEEEGKKTAFRSHESGMRCGIKHRNRNITVWDRGGSCKYFIDLNSEKKKMEQNGGGR